MKINVYKKKVSIFMQLFYQLVNIDEIIENMFFKVKRGSLKQKLRIKFFIDKDTLSTN